MTVIAVTEGPEKSGKSTLIREVAARFSAEVHHDYPGIDPPAATENNSVYREAAVWVRHWSGSILSIGTYALALARDCESPYPIIWDRSWASEAVYSRGMNRPDRGLRDDWWFGEWLFARAVQTTGILLMVLGPDPAELKARRTPDDLEIEPAYEQGLYAAYAQQFGWTLASDAAAAAETVLAKYYDYQNVLAKWDYTPPRYAGPIDAPILFVGESRNTEAHYPIWLPFSSSNPTRLARSLGSLALSCGWTNADELPTVPIRRASLVIACGKVASAYVLEHCGATSVWTIPHPSALYRWGTYADTIAEVESDLRQIVSSVQKRMSPMT